MSKGKEQKGIKRRTFIKMASGAVVAVSSNWFLPKIVLGGDDEIRIGAITEMSGPASTIGVQQMQGNELAVEIWNKRGGVLGKKIKLYKEDDESKKDVGLARARRLVEREKVDFLTGICFSSISMAIQPYAREKKKLFFNQASANDLLVAYPHCNRYFFKAAISNQGDAVMIMEVANKVGPKWYFTADNYSFGKLAVKQSKKYIKKVRPDMVVAGEDYTTLGEANYSPFLSKAIASKADAMNSNQFGAGWSRVIKQARALGYKGHIHHSFFSYADALAAGDAVLGMTAPVTLNRQNPATKEFSALFKGKFGNYPGWPGAYGYNGIDVILQAVKAAGSSNTEKVIDALENMKFNTVVSPVYYFRKADHLAVMERYLGEVITSSVYKYDQKIIKTYSAEEMSEYLPPADKRCAPNMKMS